MGPWKYDVFLSFRGKDTRKNFMSHLYVALGQKGIITFKDDEQLERGKTISQSLLKAINDSKISLIVFSPNYASSSWCLDELLHIHNSMKESGQMVMPVFYNVNPSEVRKQIGELEKCFDGHQKSFDKILKVPLWRGAMTELVNLSGWNAQDWHDDSELIEEIVENILKKLRKSGAGFSSEAKNYVGMSSRLEEMMKLYIGEGQLDGVDLVGICGMGGIGKTTTARALYADLTRQFEGSCFLANVSQVEKKYGLTALQEQLVSEILMERNIKVWDTHGGINVIRNRLGHKKVLIVLDDVNRLEQLKSLAGMRDWFGDGSRIIITTRDEHLLLCHGVEKIYKVKELNHDEALRLFCLKAFKNDYPSYEYTELCNHFVNYANGLPLALDVLGSFLFGKSINEWESTLDRLKEIPKKEILDKLYISFDGLEEVEKKIFLDIACFFKGEDKDYVIKILESCGFYPDIGIKVLLNKSLMTISDGRIWMHDLLEEMGREIVRRSCYEEPGNRSRLWLYKDVYHVLANDSGTEEVEGIVVVDSCDEEEDGRHHLSANTFTKMSKLRLLKLRNFNLSGRLDYLSNKLRYLDWDRYPFKSLPSAFHPDKLVELHMKSSNIQHLWEGIKPLKMLKVIDLSYSVNLIKTMDFREVPNLEKLNLEGCTRLLEVHKSIGNLRRLVKLNLKDCKGLVRLPSSICDLKSLKVLNLDGCSKLDEIPQGIGEVTCLEELYLGGIGARQVTTSVKPWDFLPISWLMPKKSQNLIASVPSFIGLCRLTSLNLSYCNLAEGALPKDMTCLPLLQSLILSGNDIVSLPKSISQLTELQDFRVDNCKRLKSLPNLPSKILHLGMVGCSSLGTTIPNIITRRYELENLCFPRCKRLLSTPHLSSSIFLLSVETTEETFPSAVEKDDSWHQEHLTFVKHLQLFEIQDKSCASSAFSRLTSYLHYQLKHSFQGIFNSSSGWSTCLAGNEVPEWFNCRGTGCSLEIQLPPHWYNNRWMGFATCAVFEAPSISSSSETTTPSIFCDLHALNNITADDDDEELVFLGRQATQIPPAMGNIIVSDHLWFKFMPASSLNCADNLWGTCANLKASFFANGLKVTHCGFRIMYDLDVIELIQCHDRGVEHNNSEINKRSQDNDCSSSGGESCNFDDGWNPKRLRL